MDSREGERGENTSVGRHVTGRTGVEVPVPLRWLGERHSFVEKVEVPGQEQGGERSSDQPIGQVDQQCRPDVKVAPEYVEEAEPGDQATYRWTQSTGCSSWL